MIDGLQEAVVGTEVVRWKHAVPEVRPEALRRWSPFVRRDPGRIEYAGDWLLLMPSSEAAAASADHVVERVESLLGR